MTVIELGDEDAAILRKKAAAQGLTLKGWLEQLAVLEKEQPQAEAGHALQLPVRHLGAMGSLHRRDIYDDAR